LEGMGLLKRKEILGKNNLYFFEGLVHFSLVVNNNLIQIHIVVAIFASRLQLDIL